MGKINNISLNNFRNFSFCNLSFNKKSNVLFGNNGSGKTNILESISLLGKGRGLRNSNISSLIHKNENNFLVSSEYEDNKNIFNIKIYPKLINEKYKKIISINDDISKDASINLNSSLSFLFFTPEMERLFISSPNYRRNFIDKLIFSENKNYNKTINLYKKNLLERSKILKINNYDSSWLENIEKEISKIGLEIYRLRNRQLKILNENIKKINKNNNYPFEIIYEIKDNFYNLSLEEDEYIEKLRINRMIDSKFGASKIGPHKSDFNSIINNNIDASQLSTGQQKTLVLMTLIAQCNYLVYSKNITPILLFDEICSHLDEINRKILLDLTDQFDIQFFFTGTEKSLFSFMSTNVEFYNITEI